MDEQPGNTLTAPPVGARALRIVSARANFRHPPFNVTGRQASDYLGALVANNPGFFAVHGIDRYGTAAIGTKVLMRND
jgi:hypothetical protein